jgi:ferredoxin
MAASGMETPLGVTAEYQITLAESGMVFQCKDGQNVLAAMEKLGRRGIPVGCRGGGCGICRVQVTAGTRYRTQKMSRAQVSESDLAAGICLACKLIPEGDLALRALGLFRKAVT